MVETQRVIAGVLAVRTVQDFIPIRGRYAVEHGRRDYSVSLEFVIAVDGQSGAGNRNANPQVALPFEGALPAVLR